MHKELSDLINRNVSGAGAVAYLTNDPKKFDSSITVEASHVNKVIEFLKTNKETSFNASIRQENKRFNGRDYEDVDDLEENYEDELNSFEAPHKIHFFYTAT